MRLWLIVLVIVGAAVWQFARGRPSPTHVSQAPASVQPPEAAPEVSTSGSEPQQPRHDLTEDERRGGHTLSRHVGRTDEELRERLRREPGISAASTYTDRAAAEMTVAAALVRNEPRIRSWLSRQGNRANLALDYHATSEAPIGRSLERGRRAAVPCWDAVVVLRWQGRGYFVLTSYPESKR